jgi:hypothetical protein
MLHSEIAESKSSTENDPEDSDKNKAQQLETCNGPRNNARIMLDKNPGISRTTPGETEIVDLRTETISLH